MAKKPRIDKGALRQILKNHATQKPFSGKRNNRALFTLNDVFLSDNVLTQLIRAVSIKEGITLGILRDAARAVCHRTHQHDRKFKELAGNVVKGLARHSVSFNVCMEYLGYVMNYEVDITIHLTDKEGNTRSYTHSELIKELGELKNKSMEQPNGKTK